MFTNNLVNAADESLDDLTDLSAGHTQPVKIDYKSKDMHLYNAWKETGSKRAMTDLVEHLSPLIYKEVSRSAGTLPIAALNAEGKQWAIKAVKSYDPDKGFALGTHVTNYLQRVRRLNYKYQHAARLPENMKLEFHKYNNAIAQLSEELNRDPTDDEISSHLGWSKGAVVRFKKSVYSDHLESGNEKPTEVNQYSNEALVMGELMAHLSPEERFIINNKGTMSATELAAKLGVNNNRLNYLQNKLVQKIKSLKQHLEGY